MADNWLKARQTKYTAYAAVLHPGDPGRAGAVNFLANRYDKSYDSTTNKQFSLSDQTIKVVKGLKHDVKLTYFGETSQLPAAPATCWTATPRSRPSCRSSYIDPVKKPQMAKAAGFRSDSPVVVDSGARKEERQEPHRRRSHRRADPLPQVRRAQRLLPHRRRRALHRRRGSAAASPS